MRPMFHAAAAAFGVRHVRGVEVGVEDGINAAVALTEWPHGSLQLTLVEINPQYEDTIRKTLERRALGTPEHWLLIIGDTKEIGPRFPVESLDFVYIDDDHSYEGCRDSINAWKDSVKRGGLIGGHDYQMEPVRHAVKDFVDATGWPSYQSEWDWWVVRG